ncbi:MAG: GlsB/YeaQ/YmgE family stress response membrane protein [Nitrospirota bacterium]|nr:GlsB/YeaQ/YmgE family stress response membrane protein [Nitrospirota bacterium]
MGIISWIVFGLIAGILAKLIMPGKDPGGMIVTSLIGIAGAMVGGFISTFLGYGDISGFDLRSLGLAIGGALVLLFAYRTLKGS